MRLEKSSIWHEICAIRMVLEALKPKLKNERVYWFTDNQNVARILIRSPTSKLRPLQFFQFLCLTICISIEPEWIPRKHNETADYLSRITEYDD